MWTRIKKWFTENFTPFCIFTLIFIAIILGIVMFPEWALILIVCLGYVGWTAYKIVKNQKL